MRSILPTSLPDVYSAEGGSADQQRKEALVEELAEYWIGGFGNRECCIHAQAITVAGTHTPSCKCRHPT
jgi:hypothetical protein